MRILKITFITIGLSGLSGCIKDPAPEVSGSGSELDTIAIGLPAGDYDAYSLSVSRYGKSVGDDNCSADFSKAKTITPSDRLDIDYKVKKGCLYLVRLKLGKKENISGNDLSYPIYSNISKSKPGDIIDARNSNGMINVKISLSKVTTQQPQSPEKLETRKMSQLNITLKLPNNIESTKQNANQNDKQTKPSTPDTPTCENKGDHYVLMSSTAANAQEIARYQYEQHCTQAKDAMRGGVVCTWFVSSVTKNGYPRASRAPSWLTPGIRLGPQGEQSVGWRPMNIKTRMGLGRYAMKDIDTCLKATRSSSGGVVCTFTGVGFKNTNINSNLWCGSSSQAQYCFEASQSAENYFACSFPSDGSGAGNGWRVTDTRSCRFVSNKSFLNECNQSVSSFAK